MSSWFGSSSSSSSSSPSLTSSPLPPSSPPDIDLTPPTYAHTSTSSSSSPERPKLPQGRIDPNHLYDYINITKPGSGNYSMISPMESCIVKSAISGVMGGGMGFLLGLFMSSTDPTWVTDPTGQIRDMRARDQIRHSMKHMWTRSSGMAKNFASIGAVYSAVECVIEKERGTHDMFNTVAAGCITGAGLAWRAGPQAMVLGCGGFAAFSAAIEAFMTRDSA